MSDRAEFVILGSGTSHGVPMIGCDCPVCQSTDPRDQRTRTGAVLLTDRGNLLIDTSPELRMQLLREKIARIHAVLYTHNHADHIFGLDDLRLFGHYLGTPVPLYCEEYVERHIRTCFAYAFTEQENHYGAIPRLLPIRIGVQPFEVLGIPVRPIRLLHGDLPILGYRLGDVAFCTDVSMIPEESWPLLEGLSVLFIDALREKPHPTHFSVDQALEVIRRVQPERAYLTHISHQLEHQATNRRLPSGIELAYDGLRVPVRF